MAADGGKVPSLIGELRDLLTNANTKMEEAMILSARGRSAEVVWGELPNHLQPAADSSTTEPAKAAAPCESELEVLTLEAARREIANLRAQVAKLQEEIRRLTAPQHPAAAHGAFAGRREELKMDERDTAATLALADPQQGPRETLQETAVGVHSKFESDITVFVLKAGGVKHFHMGLDEFNGRPVGDNLEAQMKLEFHRDGLKWSAPNYGIQTNGKDEWEFVVQPIAGKWYPGQNISGNFRKRSTNLQELLNLDLTKQAGLTRAEVIAVVLYTGPAYVVINRGLRKRGESLLASQDHGKGEGGSGRGGEREREGERDLDRFPVTCSVFNSAICKLAKVTEMPADRLLYRGLHGVRLHPDQVANKSFVEFGFSSATPDKAVALAYSRGKRSLLCTLLEIEVGQIDRGASLRAYSQFPEEAEVCLPPLSHFEVLGPGTTAEDGTCVLRVKLNINLKSKTVEELRSARREATLDFSRMLELEVTELLGRRCSRLEDVRQKEVEVVAPEWFNNNNNFWSVHRKLFRLYRTEMERETRNCELRAEHALLGSWRDRVKQLQRALALAPRCKEDPKAEALVRSKAVVSALPTEEREDEAERRLVAEALLEHARLCIESGSSAEMGPGKEKATQVVQMLEHEEQADKDPTLAMAHYLLARVLVKTTPPDDFDTTPPDFDSDLQPDFDTALQHADKALEIFTAAYGQVHEDVPRVVSLRGQIYARKRRPSAAQKEHMEALRLRRLVFGEKHPEIAASLSNIADVHQDKAIALEHLRHAVEMQRHQLGTEHEYVGSTEQKLGKVLKELGDMEAAEEHYEAARRIFHVSFGEADARTRHCLDELKLVRRKQAEACCAQASSHSPQAWKPRVKLLQQALALSQRCSEDRAQLRSKEDALVAALPPEEEELRDEGEQKLVADVLLEHARLLIDMHDEPARGIEAAARVLRMGARRGLGGGAAHRPAESAQEARQETGNQGPTGSLAREVAQGCYLTARALFKEKEYDKAQQEARAALERFKKAHGSEEHEDVPRVMSLLGQILHAQGDKAEALKAHQSAVRLRRVIFGEDHCEVAASLSNIADVLRDMQQLSAARKSLEEALAMQEYHWGLEHEYVAKTAVKLGRVLEALELHEEARPHLKRARDIFDKVFGKDDARATGCMHDANGSEAAEGQTALA